MTRDEEARSIDAVLAGEPAAFEALVRDNEKAVYRLCYRMLGEEQDALDASQEAFFKAYRSLGSFRRESRFSVWLYRLASNVCLDMLRKRPDAAPASLTDEEGAALDLPDSAPSPQEAAEAREQREAVRRALLKLSPDFRQAVVLRDVNGLSYEEIAGISGLEAGTVKSRIFRARRKLAELLAADRNFSGYVPSNTAENKRRGGGAK